MSIGSPMKRVRDLSYLEHTAWIALLDDLEKEGAISKADRLSSVKARETKGQRVCAAIHQYLRVHRDLYEAAGVENAVKHLEGPEARGLVGPKEAAAFLKERLLK